MKLNELLNYNDILIQCHDNPDADALASGYALLWYFKQNGKDAGFIYRGRNRIQKSNLQIMLKELDIPVQYMPEMDRKPELLITVDCQYGQRNVTLTEAENIAVIDHHQVSEKPPKLSEIRSRLGSCSTIIWDMIKDEGLSFENEPLLSTALYYGLYTDTNRLAEISHPLDRDMLEELQAQKSLITKMNNSNISLTELKITGKAILDYEYHEDDRYLILRADPCDPNILGVISDFSLETDRVDVCCAYFVTDQEIKFSVRSCIKEVHADELAAHLADGIGGGGGHLYKAGGTIRPEKLPADATQSLADTVSAIIRERMASYFAKYEIIYAGKTILGMDGMHKYAKLPQELGVVKLTDIFPAGTTVEIRTLEGDVNVRIEEDKYLMVGIEGEVYPITKEKFENSYELQDRPYGRQFEYAPSIKDTHIEEKKQVLPFARAAISKGSAKIYARPLTKSVKLFTTWDPEKYYSGDPGDYIAFREDDEHDIYVIRGHLFDRLYEPLDSK
ncbi:MAG: DHH family phosphoesterase [Lachnospiraceae bacterium]|nr:DHH family phosphoesterase [Lachnospiraceae bacterium]